MLVPLREGRGGRITWATELRWIYMAVARLRAGGAKKKIGAGYEHSLVTSGTEIWSFGYGQQYGLGGMLGHGGGGDEVVPRLIEALNRVMVKQVAAGVYHSMVLTSDGDVFTWGWGGQLGHGNTDHQNVPKRVGGLTNVKDIASGWNHSLAVGECGVVYTWGSNSFGQLGLGDHYPDRLVPTLVDGVNGVVAVAAGPHHSLALSRDGTVTTCGDSDDRDTFTAVTGLRGVVDIDAGWQHSIAVTCEGEVWTWGMGRATGHGGDDENARWLVPTKVTGGGIEEAMVVQVAAGSSHSMALTATGELYSWGEGHLGQLGHGDKENVAVPRVIDGIGGAVGMAGGSVHSLAITGEGRVLAVGDGGCLGLGAEVGEALVPTAIDGITMGERDEGKEGKE
jgi:alpha-tubulin suppressor-like RCC1 family protein